MTMDQQLTLISHQKSSISSVNREATVKRPRVELCRANSAASIATTCPSLTSISRGTAVSWCVLRRNGWVAGGCWDDDMKLVMTWIIPEKSLLI